MRSVMVGVCCISVLLYGGVGRVICGGGLIIRGGAIYILVGTKTVCCKIKL